MVGVNGLEPLTSRLSAECSNQLSYTPQKKASVYLRNSLNLFKFNLKYTYNQVPVRNTERLLCTKYWILYLFKKIIVMRSDLPRYA